MTFFKPFPVRIDKYSSVYYNKGIIEKRERRIMRTSVNMCQGPFLKKILLYTVPIVLTGILQLAFNAADLIVVGQYSGSVSIAAVGSTGPLTNLIVNLFIGLSVGAGVSVAQALGAGHEKEVERLIHTAIPTAIIGGLVLTVIGVFFSKPLLQMMDSPEDVIDLSALYMRIYFLGMVFNMVYNFGGAILRAAGDTLSPLLFLLFAGTLNVGLNVLLVHPKTFHMGVAGVAIATASSQALSAILVTIALIRRKDCCKLNLKKLKIQWGPLGKILRIGLPSGIQSSLFSISNVIIQSSINSFGSIVLTGNTAAGNLEGFVYTSMHSFNQTTVNFVGQNTGARRFDNVKRVVLINAVCVTTVGLILSIGMFAFGRQLLSIYITDSPEAIEYGLIKMTYMLLPYFLCGLMEVATGALRGLGSSLTPMIVSILGVCGIRLGWIYTVFTIPEYHTIKSLYLSYPISWTATLLVEYVAFFIILHLKKKRLERQIQNATP